MKIGFQGVRGANSEVGIYQEYGEQAEACGYAYSDEVFEAVLSGEVKYGFIPVENSIAGNVAINMDLLFKKPVTIIGEAYVDIQHCLLALPGTKLQEIKKVYSHPVALAQCQGFLRQWNIEGVPDFDTAGSARNLALHQESHAAAIAPSLCSDIYNLDLITDQIQDIKRNITRFVTFTLPSKVPQRLQKEKTSVAFNTRHQPGALVRCLEQFSKYGINMTRLESRPVPENPFVYTFFVDFLGAIEDTKVSACLTDMSQDTRWLKVLGSYPKANPQI